MPLTPRETYKRNLYQCLSLCRHIETHLIMDVVEQAVSGEIDWEDVGDLEHIREELTATLAFLASSVMEESDDESKS